MFINMPMIEGKEISLVLDEQILPSRKDLVPRYVYLMRNNQSKEIVGNIVFRLGELEQMKIVGHIGYTVDENQRGHGYAYQAVQLLMKLIKKHEYPYIYITCLKNNIASDKTIKHCDVIAFEEKEIPSALRTNYNNQLYINVYKVRVV